MKISGSALRAVFRKRLAEQLQMSEEKLYGNRLSLAKIISLSPSANNSIDIMEFFAATMVECGIEDDLELPAFTTENTIDEVLAEMEIQLRV